MKWYILIFSRQKGSRRNGTKPSIGLKGKICCILVIPLLPHLLQEPESLASSVADGVQQLLMNLRLSDMMISRPVPPSETGGRAETNNIGVSKILVGVISA